MIYEREQITLEIRSFIESLNHECKAGAVVVVEGKNDGNALRDSRIQWRDFGLQ